MKKFNGMDTPDCVVSHEDWADHKEKVTLMHDSINILAENTKHLRALQHLETIKDDINLIKNKTLDAALGTGPFPSAMKHLVTLAAKLLLILTTAVGLLILGKEFNLFKF